jgi:hypothetical protein
MNTQDCLDIVFGAIRHVNEIRSSSDQIPEQPDVILVGDAGVLDSLMVTMLILSLESRILERTGESVSLMQEGDFDVLVDQFRTPLAIAELIAGKL